MDIKVQRTWLLFQTMLRRADFRELLLFLGISATFLTRASIYHLHKFVHLWILLLGAVKADFNPALQGRFADIAVLRPLSWGVFHRKRAGRVVWKALTNTSFVLNDFSLTPRFFDRLLDVCCRTPTCLCFRQEEKGLFPKSFCFRANFVDSPGNEWYHENENEPLCAHD